MGLSWALLPFLLLDSQDPDKDSGLPFLVKTPASQISVQTPDTKVPTKASGSKLSLEHHNLEPGSKISSEIYQAASFPQQVGGPLAVLVGTTIRLPLTPVPSSSPPAPLVVWRRGSKVLAAGGLGSQAPLISLDPMHQARLRFDQIRGGLELTSARLDDAGVYTVEVIRGGVSQQIREFVVGVFGPSISSWRLQRAQEAAVLTWDVERGTLLTGFHIQAWTDSSEVDRVTMSRDWVSLLILGPQERSAIVPLPPRNPGTWAFRILPILGSLPGTPSQSRVYQAGSDLSPGAIAGIVLGSLLGLALLAGLLILCICCLRRYPGRASVKKQHSLTLAPVLTPPAKKIQSLTPVQTPRPLPIKTKMQSPHPAKAQQVISPSPTLCPGGSPWTVRAATQV